MLNTTEGGEEIFQQSEKCGELLANTGKEMGEVQTQLTDIITNSNAISESLDSCQGELASEESINPLHSSTVMILI